jgi:MraZ protein
MESGDNSVAVYNGHFTHGVDEKRRVQIPAKWRPAKAEVELTLIFWTKPKEGPCLRVLPPSALAKLMRDLDAVPNTETSKGNLKRYIGKNSAQVTLDKAGRICLPEQMATAAGITKDAVLVGVMDKFEIWSPTRFEKVEEADAIVVQEALRLLE